jgi:hypothetical protein
MDRGSRALAQRLTDTESGAGEGEGEAEGEAEGEPSKNLPLFLFRNRCTICCSLLSSESE